jgi:pilus assembly protein CpaC
MNALSLCVFLATSLAAYAQQPAVGRATPPPTQIQPDTSGGYLKQMLLAADDLGRTGLPAQAAELRRRAEQERQVLILRLAALRTQVNRIEQFAANRQQLLIHVKILEVSLTKLRTQGFDVARLLGNGSGSLGDAKAHGRGAPVLIPKADHDFYRLLDRLLEDKLMKVIAEPSLLVFSGQAASYRAEGEIPVAGPPWIETLKYGTHIQITPEVLADRSVRLAIRCRVYKLEHTTSMRVLADSGPSASIQEIVATAITPNACALLLSGFVRTQIDTESRSPPVAGTLPPAGAQPANTKALHDEVATLVLITPEIVDPLDENAKTSGDPALSQPMPTDLNIRR